MATTPWRRKWAGLAVIALAILAVWWALSSKSAARLVTIWKIRAFCNGRIFERANGDIDAFFLDDCDDAALCLASKYLKEIGPIHWLYVQSARVSVRGLDCIPDAGPVDRLTLIGMTLPDDAINSFEKVVDLEVLDLERATVSHSAIVNLRHRCPHLQIVPPVDK